MSNIRILNQTSTEVTYQCSLCGRTLTQELGKELVCHYCNTRKYLSDAECTDIFPHSKFPNMIEAKCKHGHDVYVNAYSDMSSGFTCNLCDIESKNFTILKVVRSESNPAKVLNTVAVCNKCGYVHTYKGTSIKNCKVCTSMRDKLSNFLVDYDKEVKASIDNTIPFDTIASSNERKIYLNLEFDLSSNEFYKKYNLGVVKDCTAVYEAKGYHEKAYYCSKKFLKYFINELKSIIDKLGMECAFPGKGWRGSECYSHACTLSCKCGYHREFKPVEIILKHEEIMREHEKLHANYENSIGRIRQCNINIEQDYLVSPTSNSNNFNVQHRCGHKYAISIHNLYTGNVECPVCYPNTENSLMEKALSKFKDLEDKYIVEYLTMDAILDREYKNSLRRALETEIHYIPIPYLLKSEDLDEYLEIATNCQITGDYLDLLPLTDKKLSLNALKRFVEMSIHTCYIDKNGKLLDKESILVD